MGAATTEDEGVELVLRTQPDLLICSSDLETGYGPVLLRRVKAELPTCQLLIVLERETKALVREALDAFADGVIFQSSLGTGRGDLIAALHTLADGGVDYPADIRRLAAAAVARGLKNNAIADLLGISLETVKTHVGNAMDKLGARDRTQMAVSALLYGLIDPLDS